MSALHELTLTGLSELIRTRRVSSVEATRAMLDRIAAKDGALRSFAVVTPGAATEAAEAADAEIAAGRRRGPLHGVPLAVKDLFWTKDAPTAAGTAIHAGFRADEDATAVRRPREAGAVLLGKLQMTEGAYSDHHPSVTPPQNPWGQAYWTGISSSGPGVAVAAGLCFGALASDTGGSIRWPAAQNGVVGLKPTWGRVSRHGAFELAASLDHVGPIARSAADAGLLLDAIAGPDPADPTALQAPPANCAVEAAVAHRATYPERKADYGPVLASVIEAGLALSGVDYQQILLRRMALRGRFAALFETVDLLLTPVHPFAPLTLETIRTLGERPELVAALQRFTCPFDMTGGPTITLPGGADAAGVPVGVQLAGRDLSEALLVRAGVAFESATRWGERRPPV